MATAAMLKTIPSKPILSEFTDSTALCRAPGEVLDTLHDFGFQLPPVVGSWGSSGSAVRLAFDPAREGRLHSVPAGWWEEYSAMASTDYDPGVMMARSSLMACTWTETMQMLDPIGIDRWPYEMSLKYGVRDAFTCYVGRRWLVSYWSPERREASWRSRRTELWHHRFGKPPQVVARALAKQQDVGDARLLKRDKPRLDLPGRADQRMRFRRVGIPEDVRPRPALRTARER